MQFYKRFQKELLPPDKIKIENTVTGTGHYVYYITKTNWNGETNPKKVEITNGPTILDKYSTIKLSFDRDNNATSYKIYGRKSGTEFGLLIELENNLETENSEISFLDDGSITPDTSKTPPNKNTTGRLSWNKLLFRDGKNLQSAELNDIQEMNHEFLSNLGSAIYSEGDIIEGCFLYDSLSKKELNPGEVKIDNGKMFILGMIREVPGTDSVLYVPSAGKSNVGIKVTKEIITPEIDKALKDPARGSRNFNRDGAFVENLKFEWVCDEPGMLPVYSLEDGHLFKKYTTFQSNLGKFANVLSETIKDQSGDFVLKDFIISLKENEDSPKQLLDLTLEPGGIAYINGSKTEYVGKQTIHIDKGIDSRYINGQFSIYDDSERLIKINKKYVAEVTDLSFEVEKTVQVLKGAENSQDELPDDTVFQINSVSYFDGSSTITYSEGTDFIFTGQSIDWSLNGDEPPVGVNYDVTYMYVKTGKKSLLQRKKKENIIITKSSSNEDILPDRYVIKINNIGLTINSNDYNKDIDYSLDDGQTDTSINNGKIVWLSGGNHPNTGEQYYVSYEYYDFVLEGDYISSDSYDDYYEIPIYKDLFLRDCIDFRTNSSDKPQNGYKVLYDYRYYQGRIDQLYIDYVSFRPNILRGVPDDNPIITEKPTGFIIAEINIPPVTYKKEHVIIKPVYVKSYTMEKIEKIKKRVENLEYYILLENLEKDALYIETPAMKKGVFTESFLGSEKVDFGYRINDPNERCYYGFNREEQFGHLPVEIDEIHLTVNENASNVFRSDEGFSLPYSTQLYKEQLQASKSVFIQPYEHVIYDGIIKCLPSSDTWFDTEQKAKKQITFDESKENIVAYGKVGPGVETQWDSWKLLSIGTSIVGSFSKQEEKTSSNTTELSQVNNPNSGYVTSTIKTSVTNNYNREKIEYFRERTGIKSEIRPETITQDLGNRVVDMSVVPMLRRIPIRIIVDGVAPNEPHMIKFNGIQIKDVYPYNAKVGTDIPNPYGSSPPLHYTKFLENEDYYINKISSDFHQGVTIDSEGFVYPNDKGKASVTFLIPENVLNGNIEVEFVGVGEEKSNAKGIFYGQGYQQTKQKTSMSIKRSINIIEKVKETSTKTEYRDVLTGVSVDTKSTTSFRLPPLPPPPPPNVKYAPLAEDQELTIKKNETLNITLTGKDTTPDINGNLIFELKSQPSNGTLSGTPPNLVYTPNTDYVGTDQFTFIVTKNNEKSPEGIIKINIIDPANKTIVANNVYVTLFTGESIDLKLKGQIKE